MHFSGIFHNNQYLTSAGLYQLSDYPTFGSPMPNRQWNDPNSKYKYGFNGKEKDDDINVNGGSYDFGARIYDSRICRFLSLDSLQVKYPAYSPYIFAGNSPLKCIDIAGREVYVTGVASEKLHSMPKARTGLTLTADPVSGKLSYATEVVTIDGVEKTIPKITKTTEGFVSQTLQDELTVNRQHNLDRS